MDPLSITASVVTVTAAAITVGNAIVTIIERLKNAPEEILFLHNDVSDAMIILSNITINNNQTHLVEVELALPDTENNFGNPEIIAKAEIIIGRVELVLRQIDVLLREITKSRSPTTVTLHYRPWLTNRSKLRMLRAELRELKANLAVYFSASSCSYAHRSVILLKKALAETVTTVRHQNQHNNVVDGVLQRLNDQLSELTNMPESQRQLLNMFENLSMTLVASGEQKTRTVTTTTEVHQEPNGISLGDNPQQPNGDRSVRHISLTTETESVSKLKVEFSRFQKKGCVSDCFWVNSSSDCPTYLYFLNLAQTVAADRDLHSQQHLHITFQPASFVRPISTDFSIYRAIEQNDVQRVRSIIERKAAHPSAPFMGGWTPLHVSFLNHVSSLCEARADRSFKYAIDTGSAAICKTLIASGADVHVEDGGDQISALEAVWSRILSGFYESDVQTEMEQIFSDKDCIEEMGLTKLHRIVLGLESGCLAAYLAEHPDTINVKDSHGETALSWAARRALLDEVEILLRAGADPNICTPGGHSPLLFAAEAKKPDCLQPLLDHGADVHAHDSEGQTALHYAAQHRGEVSYYKPLIAARADVNHATKNALTVLVTVIAFGHNDAVKLLIEHGAEIDRRGQHGKPPIFYAVEYSNYEALKFLFAQGATITLSSDNYPTIAHVAAHHADVETLRILTNHKLSLDGVECVDKAGLTIPQILDRRLETFLGDKTEFANAFGAFLASISIDAGNATPRRTSSVSTEEDDMGEEVLFTDAVEYIED